MRPIVYAVESLPVALRQGQPLWSAFLQCAQSQTRSQAPCLSQKQDTVGQFESAATTLYLHSLSASCNVGLTNHMSGNGVPKPAGSNSAALPDSHAADTAAQKMSGLAGILQSARNSINRNMEPFSEGLHKVVGGSTDSGYESDSEASLSEVRVVNHRGTCTHVCESLNVLCFTVSTS